MLASHCFDIQIYETFRYPNRSIDFPEEMIYIKDKLELQWVCVIALNERCVHHCALGSQIH